MRIARKDSQLTLALNPFEARLLRRVLRALIENYQIQPDQIDSKAAQAWYSRRGCLAAKMSAEETREWLEHLHSFRSARLGLLERVVAQLAGRKEGDRPLRLPLEEAPDLMAALNDHRLFLAARHDIGQAEMDLRTLEDFETLKPPRRLALLEIHLLAQIVEHLLHYISPEAAGWMEG